MIISIASSTNPLLIQLQANGLSAAKANLVQGDLAAAVQTSAASSAGSTTTTTSVRAALNTKIDADVAAGKLSKSDAAAVKKTLDDIDGQSGGSTSQSAPASAPAGGSDAAGGGGAGSGGGGGGGGSSAATEVSETVTVTGSTKTTIITYSDGTTSITTTTATASDVAKYDKHGSSGDTKDAAQAYLSTVEPGSLVDQAA